ncbi:MAG: hypothetical protein JO171_19315 [Paludibacterium sp.]|uniref:hypothetical protein n=1 Tax=Paludibacterium sp. TaxID=1917523 RepID=UPI0025EF2D34|nr:hypothetical protein [Paludibacterium sp.]MBV8049307.1 hypothetical protein [Paludibacterium sp.]MBV8645818.1 hypothetical protein [Paludibacterium sp.]
MNKLKKMIARQKPETIWQIGMMISWFVFFYGCNMALAGSSHDAEQAVNAAATQVQTQHQS